MPGQDGTIDKKDFFISYTKIDRSWAEWIAWVLEEEGYSVILDTWDFPPGGNFIHQMDQGLRQANRIILVVSPDYFSAPYPKSEWAEFFRKDPAGERALLVPIIVREYRLDGLLGPRNPIRLADLEESAARQTLIEGIQARRRKPSTQPVYPAAPGAPPPRPRRFPGNLPPVWNVPYNRNPHFAGRGALLETVREAFISGSSGSPHVALHGLGGIGKTQLATHYAYEYSTEYDIIWWTRAKDKQSLARDYAALATPLELGVSVEENVPDIVNLVRRSLAQTERWLLIFDDAAEPNDIDHYLPQGQTGHVLITSRNPNWRRIAQPLEVEVFPPEIAAGFLLDRTGQTDLDSASALAKKLGGLVLALEVVAAYIEETGIPLSEYDVLFDTHRADLLAYPHEAPDHSPSLATTIEVSIKKVEEDESALGAADLLKFCALLDSDDIPLDLFPERSKHLPKPLGDVLSNRLLQHKAVALLRRHSLLKVDDERASMHLLVQAFTYDRMTDEERNHWVAAAVDWLDEVLQFDEDDRGTWADSFRLVPHCLTAAQHTQKLNVASRTTAHLLKTAGLCLRRQGGLKESASVLERAFNTVESSYACDDTSLCKYLSEWGTALRLVGKHSEAERVFLRSMQIAERGLDAWHTDLVPILVGLGAASRAKGALGAAVPSHERALSIVLHSLGPAHPSAAETLAALGMDLNELGRHREALVRHQQALAIDEAKFGKRHRRVAMRLNNVGWTHKLLGQPGEALVFMKRALEIDEEIYGPNHPSVATRVNNLGNILRDLGKLTEARSLFERAITMREAVYGREAIATARSLSGLAGALLELGKIEAAHALAEEALMITERRRGDDHPLTAIRVRQFGEVLHAMGALQNAADQFKRAININVKRFRPRHPRIALNLAGLSSVWFDLGEYDKARRTAERALEINTETFGREHPRIATALVCLGNALAKTGQVDTAMSHHEQALEMFRKVYGSEHPKIADTEVAIGDAMMEKRDRKAAKARYDRACRIYHELLQRELSRDLCDEDHYKIRAIRARLDSLN